MTKPPEISAAVEPHAATGVQGYDEFEIDVEAILRDQLPRFFSAIDAAPLTGTNVAALPERAKGAYMLLFDGAPVYAGKTDTRHGFRDRLLRHSWTVQGRKGLDPARMAFKAVRIMVFSAFDVEAILITEMKKAEAQALPWNNSGFGSNDPGKNRDGQQPADFDQWYPVDIDFAVDGLPVGQVGLQELLRVVKGKLPYLIRNAPLPDDVHVSDVPTTATVREILNIAITALPPGWQVTVLHGRVIIYNENREYPYKLEVMRS
jgi:hypothetical protein